MVWDVTFLLSSSVATHNFNTRSMFWHKKIKFFLDEFLNKVWLVRLTILNPIGNNFSCKTCD